MIVGCSAVLAALSELQAQIARSGFLELSAGQWLTLVARYVYGIERYAATFATGELRLENAGGGVYSFDPDDLIFANPTNGQTYRNVAPVAIAAFGSASVAIQATEAGSDGSAGTETITKLTTVVLGLSCKNPAPLTGTDEETDALLRERCREMLGALSPMGPWDAYGSAVRNATRPDGSNLGVTRIRIVKDGRGTVTTYVADADGAIIGSMEDPASDLGIAHEAISRRALPIGVDAITASASTFPIPVSYAATLYSTRARDDDQVRATIKTSLEAFFAAQPIGGNVIGTAAGKVFRDAVGAAIVGALPGEIFHVIVTEPASDVELTPNQVAVLGGEPVGVINQVPPAQGFGGALPAA
jgi:uncharacterized phage protein gp47/JayE